MLRADHARVDPKRRAVINPKKSQFASTTYEQQEYKHRLNFYTVPPTADITLEEFEEWAINRLKGITRARNLVEIATNAVYSSR